LILYFGKKLGRDWVVLELDYKRKRKAKVKKGKSDAKSKAVC
jgi:hypothetical protein